MKPFPAPFFNYFNQPSPPIISKLKCLHGILRSQLSPEKWSQPFVAFPPFDNFKMNPTPSPPRLNLYALPSPKNMKTTIK